MLLKKPGQFAVGSATQSGAGLLDLNFLNSDATLSNTITHSRAGNATMVASDGLIKWAPHNLLKYSEQFDNSFWAAYAARTVVANATTAPDGTTTADEVIANTANTSNGAFQNTVSVSVGSTISFYAKASTVDFVAVGMAGPYFNAWFNLSTGTVESSANCTASIINVGNGWYRCVLANVTIGSSRFLIAPKPTTGSGDPWSNVSNAVGDSVYLWGAHLYRSDLGGMAPVPAGERVIPSASTYVPTTSSARYLPRVGHHVYNGSAWVNEGVLAESEARTNVAYYSNDISETTTGWTANSTLTAPATGITGIDGVSGSPFKLIAGSGGSVQSRTNQNSVTSGSDYVLSAILKDAGDGVYAGFSGMGIGAANENPIFDLVNGTVDVGTTTTVVKEAGIYPWNDDGWYLCWARVTAGGTIGVILIISQTATNNTGTVQNWTGDDTSGYYVAYVGCEQTSDMPSSPIPTAGSTVTRAAETFTIPAANLPYNSLAMSIQMNGRLTYADEGSAGQVTYAQWEDDTNNRITLSLDTDSTATGEVNFTQVEGGTADTVASSATEYAPGILVPFNIASRHGMTFVNGAVDGVALTANTTPTNLPDLSATDLNLAYDYMGTVERFRVWGFDLGDGGIEGASS